METSAQATHRFCKYLCQARDEAFGVFLLALKKSYNEHIENEIQRVLTEGYV